MKVNEIITEDWWNPFTWGDDNFEVVLPSSTRGEDVKKMQMALQSLGYSVGPPGADGIIGPYTRKAITSYQLTKGIKTRTPSQPSADMIAMLNKEINDKGIVAKLSSKYAPSKPKSTTKLKTTTTGKNGKALREPSFLKGLQSISNNLGIDPNALLGIMKLESGLNPAAVNKSTNATGLIQFMPKTALGLGTSVNDLYNMSATEQLPYVEKYLRRAGVRPGMDIGDIYLAVFMPAMLGKPDNHIISKAGKLVYDYNKGLDVTKDGILTVADVKTSAQRYA